MIDFSQKREGVSSSAAIISIKSDLESSGHSFINAFPTVLWFYHMEASWISFLQL